MNYDGCLSPRGLTHSARAHWHWINADRQPALPSTSQS